MPELNDRDKLVQDTINAYLATYTQSCQTDYEDAIGAVFVSGLARAHHDLTRIFGLSSQKARQLINQI